MEHPGVQDGRVDTPHEQVQTEDSIQAIFLPHSKVDHGNAQGPDFLSRSPIPVVKAGHVRRKTLPIQAAEQPQQGILRSPVGQLGDQV